MNKIWLSFLFCIGLMTSLQAQMIAVKSNIVYDATGTFNLGMEYAVNKQISIDLSGNYNGWDLMSDGRSWQHWMVQPEVRYWMLESFNGHYFGVHGIYGNMKFARLDFGLMDLERAFMYDGPMFGGGVSYGYQLYITPRLNIEFSVGVGYLNLKYKKTVYKERENPNTGPADEYKPGIPYAGPNGFLGEFKKGYFGPTKLGISIVYIIN